jgi:hypothetical protein
MIKITMVSFGMEIYWNRLVTSDRILNARENSKIFILYQYRIIAQYEDGASDFRLVER